MEHPHHFPYNHAEYETLPCNLCGRSEFEVLARRDSSGLPVQTVICTWCGLIFINPRMTKEWYRRYYEEEYREQRSPERERVDYYASTESLERQFEREEKFGRAFASLVEPHVKPGFTIEVGSSVGGVLAGFQSVIPSLTVQGIEPSSREAGFASSRGIPTIASLFEDIRSDLALASNIIIARSLNHLLDPRKFLVWAWHQLGPDGRLIIAVQNFRHSAKKHGFLRRAVQIDHTFMFTEETLLAFVRAAGFEPLFLHSAEYKPFRELWGLRLRGLTRAHLRLVARKSARSPFGGALAIPRNYEIVRTSLRPLGLLRYFLPYQLYRRFVRRI